LDEVRQTIKVLLQGPVDYEFRTTYVPTIHSGNDLQQICSKIRGCKKYVLQNFKNDVETLDPTFKSINPFSQKEMKEFLNLARKFIPNTRLR
jgi:pyruvate formate lyase activating enzyme